MYVWFDSKIKDSKSAPELLVRLRKREFVSKKLQRDWGEMQTHLSGLNELPLYVNDTLQWVDRWGRRRSHLMSWWVKEIWRVFWNCHCCWQHFLSVTFRAPREKLQILTIGRLSIQYSELIDRWLMREKKKINLMSWWVKEVFWKCQDIGCDFSCPREKNFKFQISTAGQLSIQSWLSIRYITPSFVGIWRYLLFEEESYRERGERERESRDFHLRKNTHT